MHKKIFPKKIKLDNIYTKIMSGLLFYSLSYFKTNNILFPLMVSLVGTQIPKIIDTSVYYANILSGYKYTNKSLADVADKYFGNKKLSDLDNLVCIPSYELTTGQNIVFKYPHQPYFNRDSETLLKDVILSTTCAPTYFSPYSFKIGHLVDGGIWANNPAMVGITEALNFFVGENKEYSNYELLSIGNIAMNNNNVPKNNKTNKYFWNITNMSMLIDVIFDGNSKSIDHYCNTISKTTNNYYVRIESKNLSHKLSENCGLDNAEEYVLKTYKTMGYSDADKYTSENNQEFTDLKRFFVSHKTHKTK